MVTQALRAPTLLSLARPVHVQLSHFKFCSKSMYEIFHICLFIFHVLIHLGYAILAIIDNNSLIDRQLYMSYFN